MLFGLCGYLFNSVHVSIAYFGCAKCNVLFDFMNCAERLLLGYDYSKSMEGFESSPVLSSSSFSS